LRYRIGRRGRKSIGRLHGAPWAPTG
jgi:hypothetical protein